MPKLSKYITQEEFEHSNEGTRRGIPNHMGIPEISAAKMVCAQLDKIRAYYNSPLIVFSGYRCPAVNKLVGGAQNPPSQHTRGEACDFIIVGKSVRQVFNDIRHGKILGLVFDQLIEEFGDWVHMSYTVRHPNRADVRRATIEGGEPVYRLVPKSAA